MSSISAYVIPGTAVAGIAPSCMTFYNGFLYFNNGVGLTKMGPTGTSTLVQIDTEPGSGVAYDSTTTSIFFLANSETIYKYGQGLLANKSAFWNTSAPQPNVLTVDSAGQVYYMDIYGAIYQVDSIGSSEYVYVDLSSFLPTPTDVQSIAIDASDNIFVCCPTSGAGGHKIIKVSSVGGTVTDNFIVLSNGAAFRPISVAINPLNQNIWVTLTGGSVDTYDSSGTLIAEAYVNNGDDADSGSTFDSSGYFYFSDGANVQIWTTMPQGVCLLEGTKILCLVGGAEKYVPIETIRKGTLVKTLSSGYKAVEFVGTSKRYNPPTDERTVERLYVCTSDEYPEITEDVVLTGAHSILVEKLTPEQKDATKKVTEVLFVSEKKFRLMACLDSRAKPYTVEGTYNVWHLALEHTDRLMNYGMYANGLLVETASQRMISTLPGVRLV